MENHIDKKFLLSKHEVYNTQIDETTNRGLHRRTHSKKELTSLNRCQTNRQEKKSSVSRKSSERSYSRNASLWNPSKSKKKAFIVLKKSRKISDKLCLNLMGPKSSCPPQNPKDLDHIIQTSIRRNPSKPKKPKTNLEKKDIFWKEIQQLQTQVRQKCQTFGKLSQNI